MNNIGRKFKFGLRRTRTRQFKRMISPSKKSVYRKKKKRKQKKDLKEDDESQVTSDDDIHNLVDASPSPSCQFYESSESMSEEDGEEEDEYAILEENLEESKLEEELPSSNSFKTDSSCKS